MNGEEIGVTMMIRDGQEIQRAKLVLKPKMMECSSLLSMTI
jgi:hypothetical protein